MTREQRQDAHEDLRLFFLFSILGTFFFLCYISAALCATKKYYREMQITGGRQFQASPETENTKIHLKNIENFIFKYCTIINLELILACESARSNSASPAAGG
jgi:hypothetical protein